MELMREMIISMAVAAIAEETKEEFKNLRVVSFREVPRNCLEQYIIEHQIQYKKYQLPVK